MILLETKVSFHLMSWLSIQQLCFKERKGKVDKYEIVSENIKEERMIQKVKESQ
jgi:hypothetical protein